MTLTCPRFISIFFSTLLLFLNPAKAQDGNADIYGRWRISKDLTPVGAITSKSDRQVRAMIGKVAVVRPTRFALNGKVCSSPTYQHNVDDTLQYFYREWRIDATSLPFGPKVTAIDVGCDLYVIYPVDRQRMIIADDGVFFEARRTGKLTSSPSP